MKNRTIVTSILAAALMAMAMTGTVLARGPQDPEGTSRGGRRGNTSSTMAPRGFVDEDGDGVNDRFATGDGVRDLDGGGSALGYGPAYGFVDEDGDGINDRYATGDGVRDLTGAGNGYGYGFVDEDGDGINDRGTEFVDEDGDGICDTCADGTCTPGEATGAARRGGRWSR